MQANRERVAKSRTVLIDNIPLDLGITSRELQRFFLTKLAELGYKAHDVQIVDCDVAAGGSTVSVEVTDQK